MQDFYRRNKTEIDKILFLLFLIIGVYLFINHLFAYFAPFVIGYLVSFILNPLVEFFHSKLKIRRGWSGLVLIIICLGLLSVLGTSVFSRIMEEAQSFANSVPRYIDDVKVLMEDLQTKFIHYAEFLPESFKSTLDSALVGVFGNITTWFSSTVRKGSVNVVVKLPNILMTTILSIISAFFFIKDKAIISESLLKVTPSWLLEKGKIIKQGFLNALFGYIKAQLMIMSVTSVIIIIGLTILQIPYSFFLGLFISLIDALPIFGSGFVFWPWALFNVLMGNYSLAIGLMVIYGVTFIARQLLEPKVLSTQIGLHPIVMLMSIYVGLKVFGGLGFIIGPMLLLMVKAVLTTEIPSIASIKESEETVDESEELPPIDGEKDEANIKENDDLKETDKD